MGTTAQKFFLIAADQADTWGTTVRTLNESDTTATSNTTLTYGTSTTSNLTRTCDPHNITTAGGFAGNDTSNRGWALNPTGATGTDSTATRKRRIAAGVWSFSCTIAVPAPAAVTGAISCQPFFYVYRVAASTAFTRSLLFSFSATSQSTSALGGAQTFTFTANSASQPEIILEPGETLHVATLVISTQTAGLVGTTVTNTQTFNTGSLTFIQTPSPGFRDLAISAVTGAITPGAGATIKIPFKVLSAALATTSEIIKIAKRFFAGTGTPTGALFKIANKFILGNTASTAATLVKTDKKVGGGSIASSATIQNTPIKLLLATIAPAAVVSRFVYRFFSGTVGPSSILRKVYGKNLFGFLYGPAGSGGGGGPTIIKRIINIFDD